MNNIIELAKKWVGSDTAFQLDEKYYCATRDIFQSRLDSLVNFLLNNSEIPENDIYILSAIAGEIGNNSFDHNLGNWPDIIGIFFGFEIDGKKLTIVLADRGQGILKTLKRVKPELKNDEDALATAFNEKISGRAPESRGNGLKFVKESVKQTKSHLVFVSGSAKAELNNEMEISESEKINGCLAIISN
ncbi:MAG: hypothetical protein NTW79_01945 [Candidatus Berkelbacteria bacterium]|nr:hypothetical protein [Candidatus Berkelbacteria bacterium]